MAIPHMLHGAPLHPLMLCPSSEIPLSSSSSCPISQFVKTLLKYCFLDCSSQLRAFPHLPLSPQPHGPEHFLLRLGVVVTPISIPLLLSLLLEGGNQDGSPRVMDNSWQPPLPLARAQPQHTCSLREHRLAIPFQCQTKTAHGIMLQNHY